MAADTGAVGAGVTGLEPVAAVLGAVGFGSGLVGCGANLLLAGTGHGNAAGAAAACGSLSTSGVAVRASKLADMGVEVEGTSAVVAAGAKKAGAFLGGVFSVGWDATTDWITSIF